MEELVSLDKVCTLGHLPRSNSNYTVRLAKLIARLLTNLRYLEKSRKPSALGSGRFYKASKPTVSRRVA